MYKPFLIKLQGSSCSAPSKGRGGAGIIATSNTALVGLQVNVFLLLYLAWLKVSIIAFFTAWLLLLLQQGICLAGYFKVSLRDFKSCSAVTVTYLALTVKRKQAIL